MKLLFTITIGFLCTATVCFSQERIKGLDGRLYVNVDGQKVVAEDVKGSQYYNENFLYAFVNENKSNPHKLRYNAYTDEMEFERDGKLYDLEKGLYKVIDFDVALNKKYIYAEYVYNDETIKGYLVELASGEYKLYKREKMEFIPERKSTPSGFGKSDTPAEFRPAKNIYFLKIGDGQLIEIPNSKSKFTDLLNENQKAVSKFIKENNISLTDEKDLITLCENLNNLYLSSSSSKSKESELTQ